MVCFLARLLTFRIEASLETRKPRPSQPRKMYANFSCLIWDVEAGVQPLTDTIFEFLRSTDAKVFALKNPERL